MAGCECPCSARLGSTSAVAKSIGYDVADLRRFGATTASHQSLARTVGGIAWPPPDKESCQTASTFRLPRAER